MTGSARGSCVKPPFGVLGPMPRELAAALAARFPRDREGYMNAKSSHVQEVLRLTVGEA